MLFGVVFTEILSVGIHDLGRLFCQHLHHRASAVAVVWPSAACATSARIEGLTATYEVESAALRGMGKSLEPCHHSPCSARLYSVLIWMATVFRLVPTFEMLMDVYVASWVFTGGALLIVYLRHMRKVSHA